jgi:cytochrome P450
LLVGYSRRPADTLPLFGNAIKFLAPRRVLFDWFVDCQRHFGLETFQIAVPTLPPGVVINDPKNLEFVLKNEASITKGDFFKRRSWDLFGLLERVLRRTPLIFTGYGIINANGDLWKAQRKAGLKFFSGTNLDSMIEDVLPEAYVKIRDQLNSAAQSGAQVDLQKLCLDLTTNVVGVMAYDVSGDKKLSKTADRI